MYGKLLSNKKIIATAALNMQHSLSRTGTEQDPSHFTKYIELAKLQSIAYSSSFSELTLRYQLGYNLYSDLVLPGLRLITHPSLRLVRVLLLVHLQETHLHSRGRVHGNAEVYRDGRTQPHLLAGGGQQVNLRGEGALGHARETANTPDHRSLSWLVLGTSSKQKEMSCKDCLKKRTYEVS